MRSRQIFGTQSGISGNVFANPQAASSAPYSQEFWRLKDDLRNRFDCSQFGLMMYGRTRWQDAEATIKYFNIVLTMFRIFVSANQLSLHGAVAEMCEEYETLHDRTVNLVVGGQSSSSLVLSVIKTEVPVDCDDLAHKDLLLQQYGERIEKLSQQDELIKFCVDAGFLNVVEIGEYFMTKDTAEFSQFHAVACRKYTLPREDEASQPKGWIQREHQAWSRIGR